MLSRRRRLLSHATLALGMGVLSWLFVLLSSTGVAKLLLLAAASASIVVGIGFAVSFLSVVSSESDQAITAAAPSSPRSASLHWTERGLMVWAALSLAGLTAQAMADGFDDPRRVFGAVANLFIVGIIAMQAVRLVRAERGALAASGTP